MNADTWSQVAEWSTKILAWVGGISGLIKLYEICTNRPNIIGEVLSTGVNADVRDNNKRPANAVVTLYIHVVNKRVRPTTIKQWQLFVTVNSKKYEGIQREVFSSSYPEEITIEDLDDLTRQNTLDYGKGVTGMLEFMIPDVSRRTLIEGCKLIIIATDSLGGRHKIRHRIPKEPD